MLLHKSLTPEHWSKVLSQLTHPSSLEEPPNSWQPKWDFGKLPASLDDATWSPQEFRRRGFPSNLLPADIPATLRVDQWDLLAQEALDMELLDRGWSPIMSQVRSWLAFGCPEYLQHPGTLSTSTEHLITEEQMQMTMESMARFQIQV